MIGAWRRYRSLPPADRRLLREALTLLTLVRCGLAIMPFAALRRLLGSAGTGSLEGRPDASAPQRTEERDVPARVAWVMGVLSRRSSRDAGCLAEALVADALLRRRGVRSALRVGVRQRGGAAAAPRAHAWVECGSLVIVGQLDDLSEYQVLAAPEAR